MFSTSYKDSSNALTGADNKDINIGDETPATETQLISPTIRPMQPPTIATNEDIYVGGDETPLTE